MTQSTTLTGDALRTSRLCAEVYFDVRVRSACEACSTNRRRQCSASRSLFAIVSESQINSCGVDA